MARRIKWGTVEDLQSKISCYFDNDPIPTIPGLCLHLDISTDCFHYYASERWKYKHKSEEEKEAILKEMEQQQDDVTEAEALEDFVTIMPGMEVIDNYEVNTKYDRSEEDRFKRQLSVCFKKVRQRLEDFTVKQVLSAKNPAGSIFLSKAVFGYRETAPEQATFQQLPTKIVIEVLPQPAATSIPIQVLPERVKE